MEYYFIYLILFCIFLKCPSKSISDPYNYVISSEKIKWQSKNVRNIYSLSGRYKPSHIIPTRFQCFGLFAVIAFPRLRYGVPITLGKIPMLANRHLPEIKPFPSWDLQEEGNPIAIQNAVDVYLDEKMVLWVLDTGWVNTLETPIQKGQPKVLGFNFHTGKLLYDVNLAKFSTPTSLFQYVVAENTLGRPVLIISDASSCSVVVWDIAKEKGGLVPLPDPSGVKGDILYMVLLRPSKMEPMVVFSHLSYPVLFGIPVSSLRQGKVENVKHLGQKTGEMVVLGTDNGTKLFFRWKGDNNIRVWDLASSDGKRGDIVGEGDEHRISTHVCGGSRLLTWSLETNFHDFVAGAVGSVGASAHLKPIVKNK